MAKKLHDADRWFSLYIRLRDANNDGEVSCCSCGKQIFWQDSDAGHFIPRQHRSTRYHEKNVHAQCRKCNRFDNGNPGGYSLFLIREYGIKTVEGLTELSHQAAKWTQFEINNIRDTFKQKAIKLAEKKGLQL